MATTGRSKNESTTGGESTAGRAKATGNGRAKANGNGTAGTGRATTRAKPRTSAASAAGITARARLGASRRGAKPAPRAPEPSVAEPTTTVPADDGILAATNARRALSPDMPRVAWLRTQLQQMETRQRERLIKVAQLTAIAIVFITFVLQNATGVNVHFLLFAINIRLIWVIFGCALMGGVAGYLIGRPDKSLRALLPQKEHRSPKRPPAAGSNRPAA